MVTERVFIDDDDYFWWLARQFSDAIDQLDTFSKSPKKIVAAIREEIKKEFPSD